jgi:hypothetical protein
VVNRLVVVLAMLVFAFMPSDGLATSGAPPLHDTGGRQERLPEHSLPTLGWNVATVAGVGRRWVRLEIHGHRSTYDAFVERGTRRLVTDGQSLSTALDLDTRAPWRRLCHPLRRRTGYDAGVGDVIPPYAYRRPFGATVAWPTVIVERCGRARPLLAHRCTPWCAPPAIAAGMVAWWEGRRLRAFLPRSRRLLSWPLTGGRFALTAHRVWVVDDGRLLSARVPSLAR